LHHPAKAKRVIYLFMSGGPSHHDTWDYKPKMQEMFGDDLVTPNDLSVPQYEAIHAYNLAVAELERAVGLDLVRSDRWEVDCSF